MGSMNWLGFSLSPQELPSHHEATNEDHISGGVGDCFDLSATDSTAAPPLHHHHHLHPSFGLLEATFHRSTHNHSQDWNMKGNSEISMLMGSQEVDHQPKLENFLGSTHCFRENNNHGDNNNYMFSTTTTTTSQDNTNNNNSIINPNTIVASNNNNNNNNGLNVSMIKTWLRSNHPSSTSASASQSDELIMAKNGPSGPALMTSPQTLSLSMGTGGTHSVVGPALPLLAASGGGGSGGCGEREGSLSESSGGGKQQSDNTCTGVGVCNSSSTSNTLDVQSGAIEAVPRKSIDTFGQRTSIYRGVTRHRWTGRYEAHLWDNSCRREGQTRKGRQVYLGGYDKEEKAARAYDLAAIKYWGTTTTTNFPISDYEKEIEEMKHMTRQEYVASLRRKSSGFSRGASIYRGVTRHHQHGRWQARIGRVAGNKDLYLGTFSTQEEAAEAYDIAAIKFRGLNAVTNFEISRYDVKAILDSTTLPIGGAAKRLKEVEDLTTPDSRQIIRATTATVTAVSMEHDNTSQLTHDHGIPIPNFHSWPGIAFPQAQPLTMYHPYGAQQQQRIWCKQEQDSDHGSNSFHDHLQHQLQLNSGTHNFFQMHNLMGLENSSLEHSSGSNSIVYGNGNGGTDGGYSLPFTTGTHDGNGNHENNGYENYYYLSQTHNHHEANNNNGGLRGTVGTYDQGSACNNWVPTAIPTLIPRGNNMAAVGGGHSGGVGGVPTFTVWNDT